jgi:sarcosine oxidase, subunit delta
VQIACPWCGPRDLTEFSYGGASHVARPGPFQSVTDLEWSAYLFYGRNACGRHAERWHHSYGCESWFNVVRDTVSHEIVRVYRVTDPRPAEAP